MQWLDPILNRLTHILTTIAATMMALMALHVVADVLSKWLFNFPLDGTLEIVATYYMVGLIFLPLGYIQSKKVHIAAEIFTQGLPPRLNLFLDGVIGLLMFAYATLMVWRTGAEALEKTIELEYLEATALFIVVWPGRWFLPIGMGVLGLFALLQSVQSLRAAYGFETTRPIPKN